MIARRSHRWAAIAAELRAGWPALLGSTIGLAFGTSILLYIAGVFVGPLQRDFGWSRSQLSVVGLVTVIVCIPLAPMVGTIVDRWGVRFPAAVGMLGLAGGFIAMGLMPGAFGVYLGIYVLTCVLGLLASPIGLTRPIADAFDEARGLALALALAGAGLVAAATPIVLARIVAGHGWRAGFYSLAAAIVAAMPVAFVLLGLANRVSRRVALPPAAVRERVPLRAVLTDRRFVRLSAIFFLMAFGVTGFTFHLIPMLVDGGMSPVRAGGVQGLFGVAILVGRLAIGPLFDRFFAPHVVAAALVITMLGIAAFAVSGATIAPVFVLALGLALGAEGDLVAFLTSRYFGTADYSRRFGLLYASFLLANGLSPLAIALIAARAGGYGPALWASAACELAAAILLATAPRFPRHDVEAAVR